MVNKHVNEQMNELIRLRTKQHSHNTQWMFCYSVFCRTFVLLNGSQNNLFLHTLMFSFFFFLHSGTTAPLACPEGSWSNNSGLGTLEDCKPCLGGFYCDSAGITKPSGLCSGGYIRLCEA